jgi:hypothetical protein
MDRPAVIERPGLLAVLPVQIATAVAGQAAGLPALVSIVIGSAVAVQAALPLPSFKSREESTS